MPSDFPCQSHYAKSESAQAVEILALSCGERVVEGDLSNGGTPPPLAQQTARWVVSCGAANQYNHPRQQTLDEHRAVGWTDAAMRDTRNRIGDFGHVLIADPTTAHAFPQNVPCRGKGCQLQLTQ